MTPKVAPAQIKAAGGRAARDRRAALGARSPASQVGTIRPGLTLDDGTTVLTDNFLKVAIPPGLARNARVQRAHRRGLAALSPGASSRSGDSGLVSRARSQYSGANASELSTVAVLLATDCC